MGGEINELNELVVNCSDLVSNIENLSNQVVLELYSFQKELVEIVNRNVNKYGTDARVLLCKNQDVVLNKILEFYNDYQIKKFKSVCTPAIQGYRHWNNVELMKDKGLVGYFFAKITDSRSIMMFCSNDIDYAFRELVPEMELLYSNRDVSLDKQYFEYLSNNYKEIDVLILHGMYNETIHFLDIYRKLRPDGTMSLS